MSTTTTVCHQEVQSSVRLQLTPMPSNPEPQEKSHIGKTTETARFSFLHSFTTTTIQTPKAETETEKQVYVHPLAKRSASVLSPRSLAMCTENLGSETGSDVCSDDISSVLMNNSDIPLLSLETESNPTFLARKQSCDEKSIDSVRAPKRLNRGVGANGGTNNFPPPLTSISGSSGIQFLPHREGGRLVLKAVPVTSPVNCFEAERGDGRLQLRLLRVSSPEFDNEQVKEIGEEEEEDEVVEEEEEEEDEDEVVTEEMKTETETETRWEDEEEEEVEEKCGNCETEEEGMEGNSGNVVGEMGMGKKLPRPSRCKESGRGSNNMVMNWTPESFWVAT